MEFRRANKGSARLRLALIGPAGSGKTYSALSIACGLAGDQPVAVIDTERGSASKYADLFAFDVLELESFHPQRYIDAVAAAEDAGYGVLVIDSLSHAWMGRDGALELVDKAAKRNPNGNSFGAWREVTPLHNALVDALIGSRCHVIVTIRAKTDYVQEKDDRGRTQIRKVGLAPVQRDGLEYEFDVVADMTQENDLIVSKTRCPQLSGAVVHHPGTDVAGTLRTWLSGPKVDPAGRKLKLWSRLNDLVLESKTHGLRVQDAEQMQMDGTASEEEITTMGKALREAIDSKKAAEADVRSHQAEDADAELFPAGRPA